MVSMRFDVEAEMEYDGETDTLRAITEEDNMAAIRRLLEPMHSNGQRQGFLSTFDRQQLRIVQLEADLAEEKRQREMDDRRAERFKRLAESARDANEEFKIKLSSDAQIVALQRGYCGEFDQVMEDNELYMREHLHMSLVRREVTYTEWTVVEFRVGRDQESYDARNDAVYAAKNNEDQVWFSRLNTPPVYDEPIHHSNIGSPCYILPDGRFCDSGGSVISKPEPRLNPGRQPRAYAPTCGDRWCDIELHRPNTWREGDWADARQSERDEQNRHNVGVTFEAVEDDEDDGEMDDDD